MISSSKILRHSFKLFMKFYEKSDKNSFPFFQERKKYSSVLRKWVLTFKKQKQTLLHFLNSVKISKNIMLTV